jgi:hypothetical protein
VREWRYYSPGCGGAAARTFALRRNGACPGGRGAHAVDRGHRSSLEVIARDEAAAAHERTAR